MDGSAADDLKSLKILVKEVSAKLASSRDSEDKVDELMNTIAVDAGIKYDEFKKYQLSRSKDYFKLDQFSATDSNLKFESIDKYTNLDEVDKEIFKYQVENLKIEQQIQRYEFLITKYLPLLDREEEILKGLHDFLKEKSVSRPKGERIAEARAVKNAQEIDGRIAKLQKRNEEQGKAFVELNQMLELIWKNLNVNLQNGPKIKSKFRLIQEDVAKLSENFYQDR